MKKYIYILLILIACQDAKLNQGQSADNVIPVAKGVATVVDRLLLSKAVEEIELIALETTEASLFNSSKIKSIVLSPGYIFISTMDRILCFDDKGKYIRDIGHLGQGNIDYNYCNGIGVDSDKRMVYVASGLGSNNELKSYSFDGVYLHTMPVAKYGVQMASSSYHREERGYCFINNKHLFRRLLPVHDGSKDTWQILLKDTLGNIVDKIYDPACVAHNKEMVKAGGIPISQLPYVWGTFSPMMNLFHDNINVLFEANDTIYTYLQDKKKICPRYIMDTNRSAKMGFEDLRVLGKSDAYFKEIIAREVYESKDYLYISVERNDNAYLVEWNKNDGSICSIRNKGEIKDAILGGKIRRTLDGGWTNDICGGPLFYPEHHNDNQWIGVYDVESLLKLDLEKLKKEKVLNPGRRDELVGLIENMTEDSNPIVVVATLK